MAAETAIKGAKVMLKPTAVPLKPGVSKLDLTQQGAGSIGVKTCGKNSFGLFDEIQLITKEGDQITLTNQFGFLPESTTQVTGSTNEKSKNWSRSVKSSQTATTHTVVKPQYTAHFLEVESQNGGYFSDIFSEHLREPVQQMINLANYLWQRKKL